MKRIFAALALSVAASVAFSADKPAPKLDPIPTNQPVIKSTECSSTGCWIHYEDGTSLFVAKK